MPGLTQEVDCRVAVPNIALGPWACLARLPGEVTSPDQLNKRDPMWLPATVPGTVAGALNAAGRWSFEHAADIDASDWWFRTTFAVDLDCRDMPCRLCFDGLATDAEVWLNGRQLLTTDNMFRSYHVDVSTYVQTNNELVLAFRSLAERLKQKRPRPRWKTSLVREQQLRWHRTSLVGRIPGWAPCAPTIGPWRDVRLEKSPVLVKESRLVPMLDDTTGTVTARIQIAAATAPHSASLRVGDHEAALTVEPEADGWLLIGKVRLPDVPRWLPHTHGKPNLLTCGLTVEAEGETFRFSYAPIGFRTLEVPADDGFSIRVNDLLIYCRGACWTVSELFSPHGDETSLRRDLQLAKDAGANMIRVGGTMSYCSDAFYRLCDEFGLLVWQDFMFANMDYPVDDATFRENITQEAIQQLVRLAPHPSIVVYCGNSEIEQQASMLGIPRDRWSNDWFGRHLPELCATYHPGTSYVPSTPTGGVLPFHTNVGISHYYGVGAYLRSPADMRQADVRFAPECLGFANVPEPATIYAVTGGSRAVLHDPAWKRRVPRDGGAGWDFEDVRDYYLRETFGVDPVALRSFDMPRYLQLSRVVSGEMMARAFAEWRSLHSRNRGALVWFYKDLWPGAGWGVVDSTGLPKAAYYFLKRSWQSRQLTLTDEGLNGLDLHLTNETGESSVGTVELLLLKEPNIVVARQEVALRVEPRSQVRLQADAILGRFTDVTYAYRFGPPQHDLVIATWFDKRRQIASEAVHFLRRNVDRPTMANAVQATFERMTDDEYCVTVKSAGFLHSVRLDAEGYVPDDNYFHLVPERTKSVMFRSHGENRRPFRPTLEALNFDTTVVVSPPTVNS